MKLLMLSVFSTVINFSLGIYLLAAISFILTVLTLMDLYKEVRYEN